MTQWPDFIVEDDLLYISCAVSYSGQLAPSITWSPTPDNILPSSDTGTSVNSTVQVNVPARPRVVQQYTCSVTFDRSLFTQADSQTSTQIDTSGALYVFLSFLFLFCCLYSLYIELSIWFLSISEYFEVYLH